MREIEITIRLPTMEQLHALEPPITLEEINEGIREVRLSRVAGR
ncbi:MAG: hypothetical protein ACYDBJ_29245 [Aggregatilineales bacterium]